MGRIFNFNPGPATLPLQVLQRAKDELVEYRSRGMSLLEMSHRGKEYEEVHETAIGLIREFLGLSEQYQVLFLGGGATLQFAMVPLNLLPAGKSCDFTLTGAWAKKAYGDAKKVGQVRVIFDGERDNYMTLPDPETVHADPEACYLHLTSNETIGGVQWPSWPSAGNVPLVCDMSSDFLSRPLPMEKFGLIYAGAQKNLGPAGVAVVILRKDLLSRCPETLPAYLNYRHHAEENSLYNTPPVFAVYLVKLTLEWLKDRGGIAAAERMAQERAQWLYAAIDKQSGFYSCPVDRKCRSRMNVVFRLPSEELEKQFLAEAKEAGLEGLKGHRSVGGCRASIYNAMPVEGARMLADFMNHFASRMG